MRGATVPPKRNPLKNHGNSGKSSKNQENAGRLSAPLESISPVHLCFLYSLVVAGIPILNPQLSYEKSKSILTMHDTDAITNEFVIRI
jgi:hypothetical protein